MTNYNGLITILMVDDRPANLVALEAVLGKVEYHLVEAQSGKEALAILHSRHDIDIILLDVQMPEMDGFECAAHIKQIPHCKDIPIIFITAIYKEDPFIRKGYEVGAIDYFSKPFDPEILRTKVKIYSSFRHKNRLLRERETRIQESEELLKTGRKLSAILETLPVGVIIADQQGHICQSNEQVSRILKSSELIQKDSYGEILGWWDGKGRLMKNPNGPLIRAITKGESSHNETMEVECFDGTKKTLVASASPLRGLEGHIMGAVVVVQDITEHKKIEADMESRILRLISAGVELESIHR